MVDGRLVHDHDLVWLTTDLDEAESWATHTFQKSTWEDVKAIAHGRYFVYEVEPIGPVERRAEPHSRNEFACQQARVVRLVKEVPFFWQDWRWERNTDWPDEFTPGTWIELEEDE